MQTPFRAPKDNAIAELWVRSVRQECLDHLLIQNQQHLTRVLREYIDYYNVSRLHQELDQQSPVPIAHSPEGVVRSGQTHQIYHSDYKSP